MSKAIPPELIAAYAHSTGHRLEMEASERCGCFHCLAIFEPSEIDEWIDELEDTAATAACPQCGVDSVLGSASGYPITREFLELMQTYWF